MKPSKTLIVIPVFNAEECIERTLKSCLNQTLPMQILVVDNCSNDNTQTIVKEYEAQNERVKLVINEQNYGRVGNWNRCLELFMQSEYEYIKYVFSGDEIFPTCIEKVEQAFSVDEEIGAIAFAYEFATEKGHSSISKYKTNANYLSNKNDFLIENLVNNTYLGAILACVYAKKAIGETKFHEEHIVKSEFDIRVAQNSKGYYLHEVLGRFNLDCHKTFEKANSIFVNLEFSYVESREFTRLKSQQKFTQEEEHFISQAIIYNTFNRQLQFSSYKNNLKMLLLLLKNLLDIKKYLKNYLKKKLTPKQIMFLKNLKKR